MAIVDSELQFYKSETVSDLDANGGRMGNTLVVSNVQQNVFPHVFKAERLVGSTKYRKLFPKVSDPDTGTLFGAKVWLDNQTSGDDWMVAFLGTDTDTQADISASASKIGVGVLTADALNGTSTIVVNVEDTSLTTGNDVIFRSGDTVVITNKVSPDSESGNVEEHTLASAPVVSGTEMTLTIDSTLANDYLSAANSRVSSVLDLGDLVASTSTPVVTSVSGTFNNDDYPILPNNVGSVYDSITLTFTSATGYDIVGTSLGSLGGGTTTADTSPNNPNFTQPYFTIQSDAFGGTFTTGDTITFVLNPASHGIWEKRVVPADASPISTDVCTIVFSGESA